MDRLVFYSLLGGAELYAAQLLRSVASLRWWNRSIAVRAYLYGDVAPAVDPALGLLHVDVLRSPADARLGAANHPTLHKWLSLSRIGRSCRGAVLYLDCDTVLFGDVARVFEDNREHDWYAREEAWGVRTEAWEQTSTAYTGRYVPPFNTGVCLIRPRLRHAMARRLQELYDFHSRLEAPGANAASATGGSGPIASPTTNTWIHEEVAVWLALGRCHGTTMGHFRREHVIHSLEFQEVDPATEVPVVCHHFNHHLDEFQEWIEHNATQIAREAPVNATVDLPALDDAPSYLETGLWDRWIPRSNGAAPRVLNPTLRIGADTVSFMDPASGMEQIFGLHTELRELLLEFASDPGAIVAVPPPLGERLAAAGVLVYPRDAARRRRAWATALAQARRQFLLAGYAQLPPLLSPIHLAWLRRRYRSLVREAKLQYGDGQCPTRWTSHNEPAARTMQTWLTSVVSSVRGQEVKPSYLYLGCYEGGSVLPEHVDREQCEFSITMLVDYLPDPAVDSPWPIYLRVANRAVAIHQRLGDALLYRGRALPHFREQLPDGHMSTSLFFHFVDAGFAGPLD